MQETGETTHAAAGGRRRWPWRWIALGLGLGLVVGLLLARKPGAPLTAQELAAARSRWEEEGPASYLLELEMRGAVDDTRRIEVEDGEVVSMTSGDAPVPPGAWSYWTVEGLFGFLEDELDNAAHPRQTYGVDDPRQVVLRADFHRRLGYPAFFLRHVLGRSQSTEWTVTRFEAR